MVSFGINPVIPDSGSFREEPELRDRQRFPLRHAFELASFGESSRGSITPCLSIQTSQCPEDGWVWRLRKQSQPAQNTIGFVLETGRLRLGNATFRSRRRPTSLIGSTHRVFELSKNVPCGVADRRERPSRDLPHESRFVRNGTSVHGEPTLSGRTRGVPPSIVS